MKAVLRSVLVNALAIWLASRVLAGLHYKNIETLFIAALVFGLVNIFVRPILKLIMFPINIITMGMFSWIINVILLYLTTLLVSGFTVSAFYFSGLTFKGIVVPEIHFTTFWAAVASSFVIGTIVNFLGWLVG